MAQSGLSVMLSKVDLGTLQMYVEKASVSGAFQMDKLQEMMGTLEQGERASPIPGAGEDKDIAEIVAAMQQAQGSGDVDQILGEMNSKLKAGDKEKDDTL